MKENKRQLCKSDVIKARFSELGFTQKKVADLFCITPQTISGYVRGETAFGREMAKKWSDAFGFSIGWLLTGEGPVLKEAQTASISISGVQHVGHDQTIINGSNNQLNSQADLSSLKDEVSVLSSELSVLRAENSHLQHIIAEKDALIKEKERLIGVLMGKT